MDGRRGYVFVKLRYITLLAAVLVVLDDGGNGPFSKGESVFFSAVHQNVMLGIMLGTKI